ncbi:putative RNA-directed DNA polymerase [Helianthus annuus]|nr:putative RNA-directed DNA polymerase [Helianthus annuus]
MTHADVLNEPKKGIWFLDSACSNHMTGTKEWFINLDLDDSFTHTVKLGNDLRLNVKGIGDVRLEVEGVTQVITRVYYVPELTSNLLSLGQLQQKDLTIVIKQGLCKIFHPQRGLITTSRMTRNRMFLVNAIMKPVMNKCLKVDVDGSSQIWHKRFGHVSNKSIRTMQYRKMVKGIPLVAEQSKDCEICKMGKQQREAIPKQSKWRARSKLELLHTDLCGPIKPTSPSGKRDMPKWFWTEATNWACHILNRCITTTLEEKVPEEAWSEHKPNVDYFRVFGCIGYLLIPAQFRSKLDPRSHKCIFLGISAESKAFKMYDPIQKKIVISKEMLSFLKVKSGNGRRQNLVQLS